MNFPKAGVLLFCLMSLLLGGCAAPGAAEQRLVSKPNMLFSSSAAFNYSSKVMPQIQPGLAASGGAMPSVCTICR